VDDDQGHRNKQTRRTADQDSSNRRRMQGSYKGVSYKGVINNCVSVVDGFLLGIQTPSKSQVSNVRSFFSGHYKCSGLNVQAAGDHHSRFTYIAVAGPGVMGDNDAIGECTLEKLIDWRCSIHSHRAHGSDVFWC
jgi:hypothetical protein